MAQGGRRARLALEAPQAIGIDGEGCRQDRDRDVTLQPRVAGTVNLSQPPLPSSATMV